VTAAKSTIHALMLQL